jgi:hypothetical protein
LRKILFDYLEIKVKGNIVKRIALSQILLFIGMASLRASDITITVIDAELGSPLEGVRLQAPGLGPAVTDAEGRATLSLPDDSPKKAVRASLPGYDPSTFWIKGGDRAIAVKLAIAGVVEGAGLVVEGAKPQETDAQAGVSEVATREDIKSTGEMGVVEDVMSTIKLMPGVGYSGSWNAMPSIRGGDPNEMTAVLDGAYVLYPYDWGGAYSIFDPNMVESAKLSNGIVSARYGRVMSGLLEVNSKSPKMTQPQFDFSLSTTGIDAFFQAPLTPNLGVLAGGKVTWMEVPFALVGATQTYNQVPYIRNGYAKAFWRPSDRVELDISSFIGTDGVGEKVDSVSGNNGFSTSGSFSWASLNLIESARLKLFVNDSSLLSLVASYNREHGSVSSASTVSGSRQYDQAFIDTYGSLLGGATGFTLDNLQTVKYSEDFIFQTAQGGASWDWEIAKGQVASFGVESVLKTSSDAIDELFYADSMASGYPQFVKEHLNIDVSGNNQLDSDAYALYDFDFLSGLLTGEAGVRVDHCYLYNSDMHINTYPTLDPRLHVEITPWKNLGWVESLGFTAGSGLYAQMPTIANLFGKDSGLSDFSIGPSRAWFNAVGIDLKGEDDWNMSLEGYCKYYYDRLYVVLDYSDPTATALAAKNDGEGFAYGFDLLFQKRSGRYWDGWLSYSFVVARFKNPTESSYAGETTTSGDPLGYWYYPSYHRFHNLNLVLNWKPKHTFTFTLIGQLATGALAPALGAPTSYATVYTDPSTGKTEVIERYTRTSSYDENNRNQLSCPISIKFTWSGYFPNSKIRWEQYFGVENILASVYSPKTNGSIDPFTGQELSGSDNADFSIGFPIPSVGFKLSY